MTAAGWGWRMVAALPFVMAGMAQASLHALVIGVDRYDTLTELRGAVNDARDIAETVTALKPASLTVLLNRQASRQAVLSAWDAMVGKAKPGDTLLLTYAGHGIQIAEAVAGQEADGLDEAWALSGFSSSGPGTAERIMDDEWSARLAKVSDAVKVVLVFDACHSGTMTRSVYDDAPVVTTRFGGKYKPLTEDALPPPPPVPDQAEAEKPNLVYLGGISDDRTVPEVLINNTPRGALSYYFSRGLRGKADTDRNGVVSVAEMQDYLVRNVRQVTESRQTPVLRAVGAPHQGLLAVSALAPPPVDANRVKVAVITGSAAESQRFTGMLSQVESVARADAELVWQVKAGRVLSASGDWVAQAKRPADLQAEVSKVLALRRLREQVETRGFAANLVGGDRRRLRGDVVTLSFGPRQGRYLTILNVAGGGVVNLLYPINVAEAGPLSAKERFQLPPVEVQPPFGADHVIAIATPAEPTALRATLAALEGKPAAGEAVTAITQAIGRDAGQVAIIGLFTGDQP